MQTIRPLLPFVVCYSGRIDAKHDTLVGVSAIASHLESAVGFSVFYHLRQQLIFLLLVLFTRRLSLVLVGTATSPASLSLALRATTSGADGCALKYAPLTRFMQGRKHGRSSKGAFA